MKIRLSEDAGKCVLWPGARYSSGYGQRRFRGKRTSAHRAAWVEAHGEIDNGLEVDHICETRLCINVSHLQLVTHSQNCELSGLRAGVCKRGLHPKTEPGTCRPCIKAYQQTATFKASVKRWNDMHRLARNAYRREWMRRKRASLRLAET